MIRSGATQAKSYRKCIVQLTIFCCCSPEPAPYRPNRRRLQAPPPTVRPSQHHQLPSPCVLPRFLCSFPRTCNVHLCACSRRHVIQKRQTSRQPRAQQLHVHGRGMTGGEEPEVIYRVREDSKDLQSWKSTAFLFHFVSFTVFQAFYHCISALYHTMPYTSIRPRI